MEKVYVVLRKLFIAAAILIGLLFFTWAVYLWSIQKVIAIHTGQAIPYLQLIWTAVPFICGIVFCLFTSRYCKKQICIQGKEIGTR